MRVPLKNKCCSMIFFPGEGSFQSAGSLRVVSHIAWSVPYKLSTYATNLPLHYKYSKSDAYAFF